MVIELSDASRTQLADDGYKPSMGARPLKRVFEDSVKKPLSKKILFEDLKDTKIIVDYKDNEYVFTIS